MSLLTKASLVMTPNAIKSNKVYSIIPSNGNGDLTFTRDTAATQINSLGNVENVSTTIPRFNYNSVGGCPSLLLEPQRTNLVLKSEDFNDANWVKYALTITPNSINSPNITLTADTLIGDGQNAFRYLLQNGSSTSGITYTTSVFAKKGTNNFMQIIGPIGMYTSGLVFANFDLNNGVVGSLGAGTTSSITDFGNGWYRCTMTATATGTSALSSVIGFSLINSATSPRAEVNALTSSIYLWGAQLEQGAYATSYIPTTTSAVTRNADVFTRNNIYTNGLITSAGGTWFVELNNNVPLIGDAGGDYIILSTTINTSGNGFRLFSPTSSSRVLIYKTISGAGTNLFTTTTDTVKIAFKWNGVTADIFVNGVKQVSATAFTATNMEYLATNIAGVPKYIKSTYLFPTPLTDTECISLTQ